jgi:hypothetical protein
MATSTFDFIVRDAASTAAGGGGDGSVPKDDTSAVMKENNALTRKGLQQNLGIQLSIAAILKQSQLFTGFVGAIFQILGGFIDVLLAPLAPVLRSFLQLGVKFFPTLQKISEGIAFVVDNLVALGSKIVNTYTDLKNDVRSALGLDAGGGTEGASLFAATRFNPNKNLLGNLGNLDEGGTVKPKGLLGNFPGSKLIGGLLRKAGFAGLAFELFGALGSVSEAGLEGGTGSAVAEAGTQGAEILGAIGSFLAPAALTTAATGNPLAGLVAGIITSIGYEFAGRDAVGKIAEEVFGIFDLESSIRQSQDNTARTGNGAY